MRVNIWDWSSNHHDVKKWILRCLLHNFGNAICHFDNMLCIFRMITVIFKDIFVKNVWKYFVAAEFVFVAILLWDTRVLEACWRSSEIQTSMITPKVHSELGMVICDENIQTQKVSASFETRYTIHDQQCKIDFKTMNWYINNW